MQSEVELLWRSRGIAHRDLGPIADCIEACAACEAVCIACADACLKEEHTAALRDCIRLNLDCADICATTARLLSRMPGGDAKLIRSVVEACARALATCGAECQRHGEAHEHCRLCAFNCRSAAERCGRVLRDLPDSYGQTHPVTPAAAPVPRG